MSEQMRTFDQWWTEIENFAMRGERLCNDWTKAALAKIAYDEGVSAALATQSQAPQGAVTGWQPIETAPKGATDIQLWARGVWYPECGWGMQTYPGNGERVTWVYQDDYDCNGPVFTKVIDPSHWMPPPAAPETPEVQK